MRGSTTRQIPMLSTLTPEQLVPLDHPVRRIKVIVDRALAELSPVFDGMYAVNGRASIPPEHLLKGCLLIALYSIRSECQLCEQLQYNLLFKWFLDMDVETPAFDATTFTKNRDRLLNHEVAPRFFQAVLSQAKAARLISAEHFRTLLEAWASLKSFQPRDPADHRARCSGGGRNPEVDFRGRRRRTVAADKAYDTEEFVGGCRALRITPQVARNITPYRGSHIDDRAAQQPGYLVGQRVRKRVEEIFGWVKTVGGGRKLRYMGVERNQLWAELTAAAYNLVRMSKLLAETA